MHAIQSRRRQLTAALALVPLSGMTWANAAYPTKPIRLVVPYPPGGSTDLLARLLSKQFFPASNQPVVVENTGGAGGNIGAQMVVRAPADGYTLEVGAMSQHAMNGSLYKGLAFDPMADFVPVAMLAYVVNVIAVSSKLPVNSLAELVAYIEANPGKVNYSSGGIGTHNHLTLEYLARFANLKITHVPYRGGGPAVAALVAGEVDLFAGGASLLMPQAQAGKVKLIAVTEAKRSELLPDVPTVSETIPNFEVSNWYGVFARSSLQGELVAQINKEVDRAMSEPAMKQHLRDRGMTHRVTSAAQLNTLLKSEHKRWSGIITSMNIVAE
ncbi:Bug family tripartite tricarboxylate transporter substrate binding protein [Pseudomonas aeruginosa]|nr:tripartite tricarboxylate transporter substrate binding protein [Pseudomonas aeruginosa]